MARFSHEDPKRQPVQRQPVRRYPRMQVRLPRKPIIVVPRPEREERLYRQPKNIKRSA